MPPAFRRALLRWYRRARRDLPWRSAASSVAAPDPWRVLVSETMLQQTTVATVLGRFEPFLARFPDPAAMARAGESAVLEAWSGLGYYGRARRLRQAAIELERLGAWPETAAELRRLPGLGPYTAAAVASIAFGEPVAAVDTNVVRVVARLTAERGIADDGAPRRRIEAAAQSLLAPRAPGDFNQAMMELGATVCRPREPLCGECPVRACCRAAERGLQDEIPKRRAKKKTVERRDVAVAVLRDGVTGPEVLVWRRPTGASVYRGIVELPTWRGEAVSGAISSKTREPNWASAAAAIWIATQLGAATNSLVLNKHRLADVRHTITHYRVTLELHAAKISSRSSQFPIDALASPNELSVHHDQFRGAWLPLHGDWDFTATPQRRLLEALRQYQRAKDSNRQEAKKPRPSCLSRDGPQVA